MPRGGAGLQPARGVQPRSGQAPVETGAQAEGLPHHPRRTPGRLEASESSLATIEARPMRIALCQIDNTVGDLAGNRRLIAAAAREASARGADLAVFPELALTGYPPRDLVEKASFLDRTQQALDELAAETSDLPPGLIVGYVGRAPEGSPRIATNSAALIEFGQVLFHQTKMLLPAYDVFDESRNFQPRRSRRSASFAAIASRSRSAKTPERQTILGPAAVSERPGGRVGS